jgi:type VI secretion system secreted protein VgrG
MHTCPMVNPGPVPHVGGPIITGAPTVIIGFMPAARVSDMAVCTGPPDVIAKGSLSVIISGMPAARIGDPTVHGGVIVMGCPTVIIGEVGGGAAMTPAVVIGPSVTTVGNNITIEGTPEFRAAALRDLLTVLNTPTGERLLASLEASGRNVTIVETAGGNSCGYANGADRFTQADGTPGAGTDSTVNYNPNRTQIGDGSEPWMTRPASVGLGHELVHAERAANGTQPPGSTGGTANRELQAVGLPPYDGSDINENSLRNDMGEPERTYY